MIRGDQVFQIAGDDSFDIAGDFKWSLNYFVIVGDFSLLVYFLLLVT